MPFRKSVTDLENFAARRICVIKPSALGDVVQSLPLLSALAHRFPQASISWVIRRDLADLLIGHPDLTEVIPFQRDGSWSAWRQLLGSLSHRRFDLVFDLQGLLRTGIMTLATRAPWRVGLQTAREGSSLACNAIISDTGRNVAANARYWRVAEVLGVGNHPIDVQIPMSTLDEAWAKQELSRLPRPVMAIHVGAGWETKRWPAEKFAEVAARFSGSVVVVGTNSERPLATRVVERVVHNGHAALNLAGQTSLKQLGALLRSVDLVVSNDSGPMHLAAALGTSVVGIFTCTSSILSGPIHLESNPVRHELVSTQVHCAASYCKTCPHTAAAHHACFAELSVDRVWQAIERILHQLPSNLKSA